MSLDLSSLPVPAVVETLDYEAILAALRADFLARHTDAADVIDLESEPANKVLEVAAYRELIIRARVNDAARAVMLPWAVGTNLENLAARYYLTRLPGEDDERLRQRVLVGYHALAGAGSSKSWPLRAMSVSVDVRQVDVWSDRPGRVKIALLARVAEPLQSISAQDEAVGLALFGQHPDKLITRWRVATAADAIVHQVSSTLQAEDVSPLTADVDVTAARVLPLAVAATLVHPPGPDGTVLAAAAADRVRKLAARAAFRVDYTRAAITAALMGEGIRDALLHTPTADLAADRGEIVAITSVAVDSQARHD